MKIAVIGGGLQGVETVYLARKAGWQVTLVDRNPAPPARTLAHGFLQMDVTSDATARKVFDQADIVFPALENQAALDALVLASKSADTPLAFDADAYAVTRSKNDSNQLFARLNLPMPPVAGQADGPVIVKPSQGSGSSGVKRFASLQAANAFLSGRSMAAPWVCQKFLTGPTYSIEVLGRPGHYRTFAVTDLFMDEEYDCKRVRAPSVLSPAYQDALSDMALRLAEALSLKGLMDVEVVLNNDRLYLLEIDARIPSQTPTAVYWATGINMIDQLGRLFVHGDISACANDGCVGAAVYEHVRVNTGMVHTLGEHAMTQAGPLRLATEFFGCDEAITDFRPGRRDWSATLICGGSNHIAAWRKRCAAIDRIRGAAADEFMPDQMGGQG